MKVGLASSKGACWKSFSTNRAIDVHISAWMKYVPLFSELAAQIATRRTSFRQRSLVSATLCPLQVLQRSFPSVPFRLRTDPVTVRSFQRNGPHTKTNLTTTIEQFQFLACPSLRKNCAFPPASSVKDFCFAPMNATHRRP